ncbi:hypothetical protein ABZ915_05015 [Streptomyces sp. NPDC046915]|uniref:hypothetical protein n=1 Tax=Streptomyces sp. NPDC046915 TaxID=3155257 RepID=UPI003404764B
MNSKVIVIDSSARMLDADIWFALPAGFVPLPLNELVQPEEGLEVAENASPPRVLVEAPKSADGRRRLVSLLAPVQRMFHVLALSGVVHCSVGLHRDDESDGSLLPSLFTLGWTETAWAPRGVTAARIAAGVLGARYVEVLDLSCGPASLVETLVSAQVADAPRELLQLAVHVPYPHAAKLAVLTLSTPAVHRADHYRDLLREVARMVTFENPLIVEEDEA